MIIIGGTGPLDASHRRPWIDWIHTAQVQAQIVRDYVKWDDQPQGPDSVVESVLRAYQIAMTEPRGPVYLCFDVELQESRLPDDFELPDLSKYQAPAAPTGSPYVVAQAARFIMEAERPVLVVEGLGREDDGPAALQSLAELMGIPVIERGNTFNLPNRHPLNVTGANAEVLKDADLIVSVGVRDIEPVLKRSAPGIGAPTAGLPGARAGYSRTFESVVPDDVKLVRIGLDDYGMKAWTTSYGKLMPTDLMVLGDGTEVLKEIHRICLEEMNESSQGKAAKRSAKIRDIHDALYERLNTDVKERWWDQKPISTARLAAEIWEVIKQEDWVLVHGSLSGWERRLWDMADGSRCIAGGGGTGTGMGVALGVALAFRGTDKVCVSIQNDGDLLYTAGSLWTAAHHQIPMLMVMFNNQSYYQDVGHQTTITQMRERSLETVGIGVDLVGPATDFATLAKSFSLYGDGPILQPDDVQAAIRRALELVKKEKRLALVDTVTQPR